MADSTLVDDSPIPSTSDEVQSGDVNNIVPIEGAINDNIILDATDTGTVDADGRERAKDDNVVLDEKETVTVEAERVVHCRPCSVVLHRLTAEEIKKYTTPSTGNYGASYSGTYQEIISSRNLRRLESFGDSSAFQEFKKSRKEYLKRKRRRSSETYYGIYSGEEFSYASDEDYLGGRTSEEDSQGRKRRKRKKLTYEDDTEWAPPCDWRGTIKPYSTRHKKSSKSLRVNTRRKRIESASSESSEDGYVPKTYSTRTKYEPNYVEPPDDSLLIESVYNATSLIQDAKKRLRVPSEYRSESRGGDLPSNPADNDLVTKILKEMADYTSAAKNGVAMAEVGKDDGTGDILYPSAKKPNLKKKRVSRVISVKDRCSNPVVDVRKLVKDMVNSVCSIEKRRRSVSEDSEKKKCKWCDTLFLPSNPADILCAICRDMRIHDKTLNKPKRGRPTGIKSNIKTGPAKSKMIHRVFKNLPKYEKQKIMYSNKANKSSVEKGYNHCKSLTVPKDLKESGSEGPEEPNVKKKAKSKSGSTQQTKPQKRKKKLPVVASSNTEMLKKTSEVQHRVAQVLKNASGSSQTQVSLTGIDKGLFLMTFPEPQHGLDFPKSSSEPSVQKDAPNKQPVTNNVQYGTYLLPPVPTVVVANYAATDAKSGDYYLSSLYYQNEMTQSKNVAVRSGNVQNNAVMNAVSLPSMPSMDQLSAETNIPIPQTYQFNSQPTATLNNNMDSVNMNLAGVPNSSICSTESSISELFSNPHLQIEPITNQSPEPEMNVEALFRNSQLQIEPLPFQMSEMVSDNSLKNQLASTDDNAGEESSHVEQQSDNMSSLSEQDPETRFSSGDSVSANTLIDTQSTKPNDLNNASKPASDSNEGTLPTGEPASDTVRMISEGPDLLKNSCAELDAICIMSVVDLDENPKSSLFRYIESNKIEYEKLESSETRDESTLQKLKIVYDNRHVLNIAQNYLNIHGSFTKFSDSLLRRARLLQIKKEAFEQETLSSCQFASKAKPPTNEEPVSVESMPTAVRVKMENAGSCSEDVAPVNIISQIQNQVDNMQNQNLSTATTPLGVVHHFPVPGLSPVSATPRSDLLNESRETPSRGSGPRTPARPESAMSQSEEMPLTSLQIKKERIEASSSPLSQCAYSQNISPQLTATSLSTYPQTTPSHQLATSATQVAGSAMPHLTLPKMMQTPIMTSISSVGNNTSHLQNLVHFQNSTAPPNVTVPFNSNTAFQKLLVNVSSKQPQRLANLTTGINANQNTNVIIKNGHVYNVQQVYLPRPPGLQPRLDTQTTTSVVNMNHLVFTQSPVTNNSGGTMIVNSGGQGMYPVQNRFSNVPISQQSSQICSPGSLPQNVQHIANPTNQVPPNAGFLMQQNNKQISDANAQPMFCAVCNKVATLRCRQCAKVAYCNTMCAKTYWHAKHKMECQPIS